MQLTRLPPEIINEIGYFLGGPDIINLRLTCRKLYQDTIPSFKTAFFSSITFDLCPHSLDRLRQVANDDALRFYVQQLIIGEPRTPKSCVHRAWDLVDVGVEWTRVPSSTRANYLDPSPEKNAIITDIAATVTKFPNLRTFGVRDDGEPNQEPFPEVPTNALYFLDFFHIGVLLVSRSNLPIQSFRVMHPGDPECTTGCLNYLLPCNIGASLSPMWATHLVDLELERYAGHQPLVELVVSAVSLRRLQLRSVTDEMLQVLTAEMPDDSKLEIFELRRSFRLRPEDLIGFLRRMRKSIRHVFFRCIGIQGNEPWTQVLASWAVELKALRSFALHHLTCNHRAYDKWAFDGVLEWDGGGLAGGELEFVAAAVAPERMGVVGVAYRSEENADVRRVLARMAEVGRVHPSRSALRFMESEDLERYNSESQLTFEAQHVVGGGPRGLVAKMGDEFEPPVFKLPGPAFPPSR
ncbi:hypothetical protein OQA88_10548 [Cercophora sp. LCS_1]